MKIGDRVFEEFNEDIVYTIIGLRGPFAWLEYSDKGLPYTCDRAIGTLHRYIEPKGIKKLDFANKNDKTTAMSINKINELVDAVNQLTQNKKEG